jgi:hypothetical protein
MVNFGFNNNSNQNEILLFPVLHPKPFDVDEVFGG